jgi:hypothetical protein
MPHRMSILSSIALPLLLLAPSSDPAPVAPMPDAAYADRVNRAARGVGVGLHQGLWGSGFGQRLHVDLPFGRRVGQFWGLRVQGTFVHPDRHFDRWDPVAFGGLEMFGRSPVMAGIVRVYGGGGVFAGGRPLPTSEGRRWGISGGGHMGIEVFSMPRMSFSVEVGGQGPVHALNLDAGASVMGGVNFYLGRMK